MFSMISVTKSIVKRKNERCDRYNEGEIATKPDIPKPIRFILFPILKSFFPTSAYGNKSSVFRLRHAVVITVMTIFLIKIRGIRNRNTEPFVIGIVHVIRHF